MVKSCWICKTAGNDSNKSYFRVPKLLHHRNEQISRLSALRKEKWRKILNLPDDCSGIRVCSDHFVSGNPARLLEVNDPDWVPTQNLRVVVDQDKEGLDKNWAENMELKRKEKESVSQSETVTCRFCITVTERDLCVNIFEVQDPRLHEMITVILGHKLKQDATLPEHACRPCLRNINLCGKFLLSFRRNEKRLVKKYSSSEEDASVESFIDENSSFKSSPGDSDQGMNQVFTSETVTIEDDENSDEIEEITPSNENVRKSFDSLAKEKNSPQHESKYDKEQIRSIIEHSTSSSEEEMLDDREVIKVKKRKYDIQNIKIRPIEFKTLKCNDCYEKLNSLSDLRLHKNFCRVFYCQLCRPRLAFTDKEEQISHKKKYHSEAVECHVCGKSYSQWYLLKHFRNHFEHKKICPFCNKIFKNITTLMTHIDNFHSNRASGLCDRCGGFFKDLKNHLNECGETTPQLS